LALTTRPQRQERVALEGFVMGQPSQNRSDYTAARNTVLDGDMTPGDIINALEQLRFENGLRAVKLDGAVRDFLVAALSVRRGKAD
jgi:hypothetical protein